MHCTACEAFLETVAEQDNGVYRAEASYASEIVRLHYDADRQTEDALADRLTRGGYTASYDRPAPPRCGPASAHYSASAVTRSPSSNSDFGTTLIYPCMV